LYWEGRVNWGSTNQNSLFYTCVLPATQVPPLPGGARSFSLKKFLKVETHVL